MGDISVQLPPSPSKSLVKSKRPARDDAGSDIEIMDDPSPVKSTTSKSPAKSRYNNTSPAPSHNDLSAKAKGKRRARTEDLDEEAGGRAATGNIPSDAVFATWRKGDDDMEPSTKMLALIDLLHEWDSTGDKAICYSQCTLPSIH
jgi:hypothetical protein